MKFLLDTHAVFWLLIGSTKLSARARRALDRSPPDEQHICDISLLELAQLDARGAISLAPTASKFLDDLANSIRVLPIDGEIAANAEALPLPQKHPFDRVIVATARRHGLTLITRDNAFFCNFSAPPDVPFLRGCMGGGFVRGHAG